MVDLKIGELAKQTGLSVRTLHYYDEIGLLSPSCRTDAEHRRYTAQDIVRLQQIISLKQLKFSLKEIRASLENPDLSLAKIIDLHRTRLQEQIALSRSLNQRLNKIAAELQTTQSVSVETLMQTMETISMTQQQYLTTEQQEILEMRFQEEEQDWQDILGGIQAEMNQGSEVNTSTVRMLARRWLWRMKSVVRGDGKIYDALVKMYEQGEATAESWGMDTASLEYILRAVSLMTLADATNSTIPIHRLFDSAAQAAMRLGIEPIRAINFDVFGTEALLLGLLQQPSTAAAQVLNSVGVTYEQVHPLVIKWLGVRPTWPEGSYPEKLPFAPRLKRVIELAVDASRPQDSDNSNEEENFVTPAHLLLGILEETKESPPPRGVAAYILCGELDVDLEQLEAQLRVAMEK